MIFSCLEDFYMASSPLLLARTSLRVWRSLSQVRRLCQRRGRRPRVSSLRGHAGLRAVRALQPAPRAPRREFRPPSADYSGKCLVACCLFICLQSHFQSFHATCIYDWLNFSSSPMLYCSSLFVSMIASTSSLFAVFSTHARTR
jgi:hypothetical protein